MSNTTVQSLLARVKDPNALSDVAALMEKLSLDPVRGAGSEASFVGTTGKPFAGTHEELDDDLMQIILGFCDVPSIRAAKASNHARSIPQRHNGTDTRPSARDEPRVR